MTLGNLNDCWVKKLAVFIQYVTQLTFQLSIKPDGLQLREKFDWQSYETGKADERLNQNVTIGQHINNLKKPC